MKCEYLPNRECQNEATLICFCATWINVKQKEAGTLAFGPRPNTTINRLPANPIHLCLEHAKIFDPKHNTNAKDKDFHWGEEALAKHAEHVQLYKENKNIV